MGYNEFMSDQMILNTVEKVLRNNGVSSVALFGSRAKGLAKLNSDLDLLIDFPKGRKYTIFDLGGIHSELEAKTGLKVDLVTKSGLNPLLRSEVMNTMVSIYDAG